MKYIIFVSLFLFSACSFSSDPEPVVDPAGLTISGEVETHEDKIAVQEEIIRRQDQEKARQIRERQDLERQDYHNKKLEKVLEAK